MGTWRTWSGWKHSSHKLAFLCVGASRRRSKYVNTTTSRWPAISQCDTGLVRRQRVFDDKSSAWSAMSDISQPADSEVASTNSEYVVVARRYRPQTFEELIGQQHVARALTGAINSDRVGHAYLFTGARGVGKTSAARILAKALNCIEGTSPVPCNVCEICQSVNSGEDVDVLEIDGASNRGIDEIRQLRQNVAIRPSRARFKIYIIDEVHMLTKEAFNALLKTLEEPPEHVKFIFATTEPNKIPITILSRCQRYDFAGIDSDAIQKRLGQIAEAEGVSVDPESLQIIAMRAAGSMRDSQSLLEQLLATGSETVTAEHVTTLLGIAPAARLSQLARLLVEHDAAQALAELDGAIAQGAEAGQVVDQLLGYFRDVMTQAVGCDVSQLMYALPSQQDEVRHVAEQLGVQTLLAMVQILDQTAARMRVSTQVRTLAEMALVRLCHLEDLDSISTLIDQLKESPGSIASEGPAKPRVAGSTKPPTAAKKNAVNSEDVVSENVVPPAATAKPQAATPITPDRVTPDHITPENAEEIWRQVVELATGLVGDNAALADQVSCDDDGTLVASFPERYSSCREFCERPTNRTRLDKALEQVVDAPVMLKLQTHDDSQNEPHAVSPKPSRRQQQVDVVNEPFVQRALELFDGDPSRIRFVPPEES